MNRQALDTDREPRESDNYTRHHHKSVLRKTDWGNHNQTRWANSTDCYKPPRASRAKDSNNWCQYLKAYRTACNTSDSHSSIPPAVYSRSVSHTKDYSTAVRDNWGWDSLTQSAACSTSA